MMLRRWMVTTKTQLFITVVSIRANNTKSLTFFRYSAHFSIVRVIESSTFGSMVYLLGVFGMLGYFFRVFCGELCQTVEGVFILSTSASALELELELAKVL